MTRPKVPDDKRQRTAQACDMCKRRKQKVSELSFRVCSLPPFWQNFSSCPCSCLLFLRTLVFLSIYLFPGAEAKVALANHSLRCIDSPLRLDHRRTCYCRSFRPHTRMSSFPCKFHKSNGAHLYFLRTAFSSLSYSLSNLPSCISGTMPIPGGRSHSFTHPSYRVIPIYLEGRVSLNTYTSLRLESSLQLSRLYP